VHPPRPFYGPLRLIIDFILKPQTPITQALIPIVLKEAMNLAPSKHQSVIALLWTGNATTLWSMMDWSQIPDMKGHYRRQAEKRHRKTVSPTEAAPVTLPFWTKSEASR
jgi:hypothetical protein